MYDDDLAVFNWMREGAEGARRCVEAQVMDLADDVAYSVHDLEDGIVAGRIDLAWLDRAGARGEVWQTVREWYLPDVDDAELDDALAAAARRWAPGPARRTTAAGAALAALKNLTSDLIGLFCVQVHDATRDKHGDQPLVRYGADLVVPARDRPGDRRAQGRRRALRDARRRPGRGARPAARGGHRAGVPARSGVVRRCCGAAAGRLRGGGLRRGARLRVVVDQVASLTDASALTWHARLR